MDPKPRKLLDQVRDCMRLKQYSHRTEETHILWIRQNSSAIKMTMILYLRSQLERSRFPESP